MEATGTIAKRAAGFLLMFMFLVGGYYIGLLCCVAFTIRFIHTWNTRQCQHIQRKYEQH
ncbi:MAG: hypothetical protein KBF74_09685 [Ferruginibacter sp.]|nr:hypothetical protein [Ferruginibacter sp.]